VVVLLLMTLATGLLESAAPIEIGLLVLAFGTNVTALQRLRHVYTVLRDRGD